MKDYSKFRQAAVNGIGTVVDGIAQAFERGAGEVGGPSVFRCLLEDAAANGNDGGATS